MALWSVVCSNHSLAKIRDKGLPWKLLSLAKSSSVWSLLHHPLLQPVVEKASGWFLSSCASLFFTSQGPARTSVRDAWGVCGIFKALVQILNRVQYNVLSLMDTYFLMTETITLITTRALLLACARIPFPPLASFVTLGRLVNISAPLFSDLHVGRAVARGCARVESVSG